MSKTVNAQECNGTCDEEECELELDTDEELPVQVPNRDTCTGITGQNVPQRCDEVEDDVTFSVCRPNPGTEVGGDGQGLRPPNLKKSGLFEFLLARQTTVDFDGDSEVVVTIADQKKTADVAGTGTILGEPCPNQSCEIGLSLNLEQTEELTIEKGLGPFSKDIQVDSSTLYAGSGTDTITLSKQSAGDFTGTFARGALLGTFVGEIAGDDTGFVKANRTQVHVKVDWQNGTVEVTDGFELEAKDKRPRTVIETDLEGTIANQPPIAEAGADETLECTSPDGARVELDASGSRDRDGNASWASWTRVPSDADEISDLENVGNVVSLDETVETTAPLGTTDYTLGVFDENFQRDHDRKSVEVVDTRPPEITDFSFEGPPCLWAPNHKYAVLRVDRDFQSTIEDACDPNPKLVVRKSTSDQPENGLGDGDTEDDIVVFPDRVCLRKERQGGDMNGRTYSIELAATDASGNRSDPTVKVRVPHDQRPSRRCEFFDDIEVVDSNSEVCSPEAAEEAWEAYYKRRSDHASSDAGSHTDATGKAGEDVRAGGACSTTSPPLPQEVQFLWLFAICALVGATRRRQHT